MAKVEKPYSMTSQESSERTSGKGDPGVIEGMINAPAKDAKAMVFKPAKESAALPKGDIDPFVKQAGGSKGGENKIPGMKPNKGTF
jgi:hypothetical protein